MNAGTRIGALAIAVLGGLVVAALSQLPVPFRQGDEARIRFAWKMTGATAEACRELSDAELEKLPPHMRNPKACIGHIASYDFQVTVDGEVVIVDTVRPPGARGDRPITVLRELALAPGGHEVGVRFDAILPEGVQPTEGLTSLRWAGAVVVRSGEVALVTLDEDARELEYRTPTGDEGP